MVWLQLILDDDFVETRGRTNVVIAAYTTAWLVWNYTPIWNWKIFFVTAGPNNYAYTVQYRHGEMSTCCKVKGITLNYKNSLDTDLNTIRNMITWNQSSFDTVRNDYKIARYSKMTEIFTRKESKTTNLFLINESYNVVWCWYHIDIWMNDKHEGFYW